VIATLTVLLTSAFFTGAYLVGRRVEPSASFPLQMWLGFSLLAVTIVIVGGVSFLAYSLVSHVFQVVKL
jgi:hypothetical protein